jgi:hypothetical protein
MNPADLPVDDGVDRDGDPLTPEQIDRLHAEAHPFLPRHPGVVYADVVSPKRQEGPHPMRPAGKYDPTSYRDSRPGRHASRAAMLADAVADSDSDHDVSCASLWGDEPCDCGAARIATRAAALRDEVILGLGEHGEPWVIVLDDVTPTGRLEPFIPVERLDPPF